MSELVLRFNDDDERHEFVAWLLDGGGEGAAGYTWGGGAWDGQPITVDLSVGEIGEAIEWDDTDDGAGGGA